MRVTAAWRYDYALTISTKPERTLRLLYFADENTMSNYSIRKSRRDAQAQPAEPFMQPVCTRYERCRDCPYPRHDFLCWSKDGECLRDAVKKIEEKEKKSE